MCADATEGFVPRISPDAIGPDNPPDAKDAFELLVHGARCPLLVQRTKG